jgi:hypothetical protein
MPIVATRFYEVLEPHKELNYMTVMVGSRISVI